jgi:putative ABC transport system substrate-binding protein
MIRPRQFITLLSGAAAWPLAARAQQRGDRVRRIGVLMPYDDNDPAITLRVSVFTQALTVLGWTDGRNVRIDVRWAGADTNLMRALAQELVGLQPDVFLASSTPATVALQRETRTIPIVFTNVGDPVATGIVARLDRPGGTSPASPPTKPRWEASGLSCFRRSLPGSSGSRSCSIPTRLSH